MDERRVWTYRPANGVADAHDTRRYAPSEQRNLGRSCGTTVVCRIEGRHGNKGNGRSLARRVSGRPERPSLASEFLEVAVRVGHKTSDRARGQVFLRVSSTCSASAATMGDPDSPPGETPVS